ncbi:MAG: hypothetical protein ACI8W8_001970 [Rhodothermales bacterium]|jgi:hypothetical protein
MRRLFVLLLAWPLQALELSPASFERDVYGVVGKFCLDCHDADTQKGERNFEALGYPITDDDMLIDYQDMLDQLNLGEMPPPKKSRPSAEQKRTLIAWLTAAIDQAQKARVSTGGETVLRRLNRREYLNTIRDIFHLPTSSFDPTEGFPADRKVHHLDNQGHALVTSGFLLDRYLRAADQIIEKALPPLARPSEKSWDFNDSFRQQAELDSRRIKVEARLRKEAGLPLTPEKQLPSKIALYTSPRSPRHMGSHAFVAKFANGVPVDGYYEVNVWAEPKYRSQGAAPFQLAIVPGNAKYGDLHLPQSLEPELARFQLKDGEAQSYKAKVWLDKGITPRFVFSNGPLMMRQPMIKAGKARFAKQGKKDKVTEQALVEGLAYGELPQIWIERVRIRGPLFEEWPIKTQRELLGGTRFDPAQNRANIARFLHRGLRRPAREEEVAQILSVVAAREAQGISPFDAFQDGLKAALCMPAFLYLDEPVDSESGLISEYAIASRLSYFLWASMPDTALMDLAAAGKLSSPDVRRKQVTRMLKSPKSEAFITGFLNSWLTLGALGETPPDSSRFAIYYSDNLEVAMRKETQLFTRHILDEGLSIDRFLKSNFSFLNAPLAKHYGIKAGLKGDEFQRVDLGRHAYRGGLLSQASVLTVTANGVDTSPVVRGVWLLENILGTPPPPPPPDADPLDPDVRGAKSIREQLQKHRSNESCADCHRRIDPLGFALENFDAIGRFRGRYNRGPKIDPSGTMPSGAEFASFDDFRTLLLKDKDKFAKALTETLMAYALGRGIDIGDRPTTNAILSSLDKNDRSFRHLLDEIVASKTFVSP